MAALTRRSLVTWGRVFAGQTLFVIAQQLVLGVIGIIVVRSLAKDDYAYYVLAVGMVTAVGLLGDAGVLSTLMHQAGRVRSRPSALAALVTQAERRRRVTTSAALAVAVPLGAVLLHRAGAPGWFVVAAAASIVLSAYPLAAAYMNLSLLRLHYEFGRAGRVQMQGVAVRAVLTGIVVAFAGPLAAVALLLVLGVVARLEQQWSRPHLVDDGGEGPAQDFSAEFRRNARRVVPNNAFYLIQGQLLIGVLAVLHATGTLAEISALSRFALLFAAVTSVVNVIALPVFARQDEPRRALLVLGASSVLYLACAAVILATMVLAPGVYLGILGGAYGGLEADFVLIAVGSAVGGVATVVGWLNQGRAWVRMAWVYIPLTILWQGALIAVLRLDTLRDAALFTALSPASAIVSCLFCAALGYRDETRAGRRSAESTALEERG